MSRCGNINTTSQTPCLFGKLCCGHPIFFKNQHALNAEAINRGIDHIYNYRYSLLEADFIKRHEKIFHQRTGAGYWIWKPWVILKTMEKAEENVIIIYLDVGVGIRQPITSLLRKHLRKNHDVLLVEGAYQNDGHDIKEMTARQALIKMGLDDNDQILRGPAVWAGIVILRNTSKSRDFVRKWLSYCEDEELLTGHHKHSSSDLPVHKTFRLHMHDQALLSITACQNKDLVNIISMTESDHYFFWHHRHDIKNQGKDFETLIHKMGYGVRGIEWKILNNPMFVKLRQFVIDNFLKIDP